MSHDHQKEKSTTDLLNEPASMDIECKGDLLTLGSGCKVCRKCRVQLIELADRHITALREDRAPDVLKHAETMVLAGQVMGQAMRYAKGDLVTAQTLLKIAAAGAETVMQMESVRVMMSNVMQQSGGRKAS